MSNVKQTPYERHTFQRLARRKKNKRALKKGNKSRIQDLFTLFLRGEQVPPEQAGELDRVIDSPVIQAILRSTADDPVLAMHMARTIDRVMGYNPDLRDPAYTLGLVTQDLQMYERIPVLLGIGAPGPGGCLAGAEHAFQVSLDDRAAAAELVHNNPTLWEVLELAGRMEKMVADMPVSDDDTVDEPHGYEYGNHVPSLLPTEFLALTDPDLALTFDLGFAEEKLRQVCRTAPAVHGRGPVMIFVDVSPSMSYARCKIGQYLYRTWAFALAIVLGRQALRDGRAVYLAHWGGDIVAEYTPETEAELSQALEYSSSGGTQFLSWMWKIPRLADGDVTWKKADAIVITDGEDSSVRDEDIREFRAAVRARKTEVFGIYLTDYAPATWHHSKFASCCDALCAVWNEKTAEQMVQMSFERVQNQEENPGCWGNRLALEEVQVLYEDAVATQFSFSSIECHQ